MNTTVTIEQNGITFEIRESLRVQATGPNGETANGSLANSGGRHVRIYPRIEFWFGAERWIEKYCDHRYWNVDDYETDDAINRRPTDSGTFDLSEAQRSEIQAWYDSTRAPMPQPISVAPAVQHNAEPIFAIGGINRGDGAEIPAPWPRYGRTCRICGETESLGAMFTTIGGDVCDDCS